MHYVYSNCPKTINGKPSLVPNLFNARKKRGGGEPGMGNHVGDITSRTIEIIILASIVSNGRLSCSTVREARKRG